VSTIVPSRRRRPPRRRWPFALAAAVAALLLLGLGVAIGLALGDRPSPGGTQTIVRTLEPLPQREP
jgi:hypothetical protein